MRRDLLILFFILLSSVLMADEHTNEAPSFKDEAPSFKVQGIVTDEKGEGLPGASVWVKGTVVGAGTNAKGEFSFKLSSKNKCVLRVSFTGYEPQERDVTPGVDSLYRFVLEPSNNALNEVVITGTRCSGAYPRDFIGRYSTGESIGFAKFTGI